jgi:hypothetical protein
MYLENTTIELVMLGKGSLARVIIAMIYQLDKQTLITKYSIYYARNDTVRSIK